MLDINLALRLQPDFIYVVDAETAQNVEISLKMNDNPLYQIPTKFSNCFEPKINQTNFLKKKKNMILRIKPIDPFDQGGLTNLNNQIVNNPFTSEPKSLYFGGYPIYKGDTAIKQLIDNLANLKRVTGVTDDLYIIVRMISPKYPEYTAVFISKISLQASGLPLPSPLSSKSKKNKYFYKYLKYKQKYLEAQQLYGKELKGGGGVFNLGIPYFIHCPKEIYDLIITNYKLGLNTFTNENCLLLTLGPNSYYSTSVPTDYFKNCWTEDFVKNQNVVLPTFRISYNQSLKHWTIN